MGHLWVSLQGLVHRGGAEASDTASGLNLPQIKGEGGLYKVRPGWRKQVTRHLSLQSLTCPALFPALFAGFCDANHSFPACLACWGKETSGIMHPVFLSFSCFCQAFGHSDDETNRPYDSHGMFAIPHPTTSCSSYLLS